MLSTYTKLLISLQQFQSLMIHHRRSAPTGKGKIIYDETQLHPPALQSSGGKRKKGNVGRVLMSVGAAGWSSTTRTALAWLYHEQPCMKHSA